MRGSLQERSAVPHLDNTHGRANQQPPLRIRLAVETSAGRGPPAMCASLWCRDSTGRFLPVRSQKRYVLPLFSGLTLFLFLAFAVHWRSWSWRGPRPACWLCGSFSG